MERHLVRGRLSPLFPLSPPSRHTSFGHWLCLSILSLKPPHFPHSSQTRIFLKNNGTAPHPNPITTRLSASCTLFSVFLAWLLSPAVLGCSAVLIISSFNFFFFLFHLVQERMPAVVISNPSRLRHFKSFLVQFPSLGITAIFKGVYLFHLFVFVALFPVFFILNPCEARTEHP